MTWQDCCILRLKTQSESIQNEDVAERIQETIVSPVKCSRSLPIYWTRFSFSLHTCTLCTIALQYYTAQEVRLGKLLFVCILAMYDKVRMRKSKALHVRLSTWRITTFSNWSYRRPHTNIAILSSQQTKQTKGWQFCHGELTEYCCYNIHPWSIYTPPMTANTNLAEQI